MLSRSSNIFGRQLNNTIGSRAAVACTSQRICQRWYTNTSVYTRGDSMSTEEHMRLLSEEQHYLTELLKTDDANAPWRKENVDTVNREVQLNLHEPREWKPDHALNG
ncbi:hypothetical protein COEREDRAFT_8656 [Coemansia reversa NRRL 1564]|uniref:Uncharacterized protein n=1 Tax=Coemansia reversa (strain ATCC 12441 / NRRL 1564) TaxID=763665 RepID=A0A2G5BB56_COERN|nr:hypothetical protein COEREDRAFT_8656 [Coemansia reversa NRRL 1564]|eukprot:PIA16245.1 hypothetical protein COEREDRAFT_8656 [Coemansia reversa NRRL 1564]